MQWNRFHTVLCVEWDLWRGDFGSPAEDPGISIVLCAMEGPHACVSDAVRHAGIVCVCGTMPRRLQCIPSGFGHPELGQALLNMQVVPAGYARLHVRGWDHRPGTCVPRNLRARLEQGCARSGDDDASGMRSLAAIVPV